MTLDMLNVGEGGIALKIDKKLEIYQRLVDIGLIDGTRVKCVLVSPFGDPKAFFIRGTVIALRNADAKHIEVCMEDDEKNGE